MTSPAPLLPGSAAAGASPRAARIAALLAAAVYLVHALSTRRVVDDCYITFRYVRNWVAGHGPVFNPGERVEGYTNFLWTALLALVHRVAPEIDLLDAARALALACGALLLLLVARRSFARRPEDGLLRAFAPLLLALHAPIAVWSTGGLETMLFALLVFSAALVELESERSGRGSWRAPALLALATMTRPDGIAFLGALALARAFRDRAGGPPRWRHALGGVLVFALLFAPYFAWRWSYYGQLLPNTVYAKVGGRLAQVRRGVDHVWSWGRDTGFALALPPLLALAWQRREPWVRLFALTAALGGAWVVAVGGDSLGMFRFIVPLAPFLALLAQEGLLELARRLGGPAGGRRRAAVALTAAVMCAAAVWGARPSLIRRLFPERFRFTERLSGLTFPGDGIVHSYAWFDHYFVDRLAAAGRWLDRNAPPDAWVASSPAGAIGFHMRQPLLDMLGLNDVHIARQPVATMGSGRAGHEKGDGRYVLSRRPRYVLMGNVAVHDHPLSDDEIAAQSRRLRSERELLDDPEFHRLYEKRSVPLTEAERAGIAPGNRRIFQWFTFYELRSGAR